MDAHLFRRFCDDFVPALIGVRIEKIHQLKEGVTVFSLYGLGKLQGDTVLFGDKKQFLVFKEGREPLLFLSEHKPVVGAHPPAFIMRLRKYCAGRRIERACARWIERKLYLEIQGGAWLCLDLRNGIELILTRPVDIFPLVLHEQTKSVTEYMENTSCADFESHCSFLKSTPEILAEELPVTSLDVSTETCIAQSTNTLLPFEDSYEIFPSLKHGFAFVSAWPDWELVHSVCVDKKAFHRETLQNIQAIEENTHVKDVQIIEEAIWKQYPVLTPLLRSTLPYLDKEEGASLYADLQFGGGDIVVYAFNQDSVEVSPWLLPEKIIQKMGIEAQSIKQNHKKHFEVLVKNPTENFSKNFSTKLQEKSLDIPPSQLLQKPSKSPFKELLFEDAISALKHVGTYELTRLSQELKNTLVKPLLNEIKRLEKLSEKLNKEEERLLAMVAKKQDALLIQAHLYDLDSKAKEKKLVLFDDASKGTCTIILDPSKTIGENMEYLFHQAGRGKRGLAHLAIRLESLAMQKKQILQDAVEESALQKGFEVKKTPKTSVKNEKKQTYNTQKLSYNKESHFLVKNSNLVEKNQASQNKNKAKHLVTQSSKNKQKFPPQVQAFRSSDGFLILRGRDTKGNGLVLKMANAHDYWVHIAEGASAHVIIRRDHPEQEVPQKTFEQAGLLALRKSWQKDQDKGLVQYSLAKYIRPMKSSKGLVHVDRSEGTFVVINKEEASIEMI